MPAPNPRIHRYSNAVRVRFGTRSLTLARGREGDDCYKLIIQRMRERGEPTELERPGMQRVLRGKVLQTTISLTEDAVKHLTGLLLMAHQEPLQYSPPLKEEARNDQ